ncbi:MAG: Zn-dependent hydrolase [Caldilineaceae bacterium]|nr:Zn-dependent hydrolase [Caldilineaceae bacterium]
MLQIQELLINAERLLQDIDELGRIGELPAAEGGGLDRRAFSAAERSARDFFAAKAEESGLTVAVDGAANLSAKLHCGPANARTILAGSHLDTVPNGGRYDGALGVLAALEALRTVREAGLQLPVHLEAIAFTDEEGRLGGITSGSRAFAGTYRPQDAVRFITQAASYPEDFAAMQSYLPGGLSEESMLNAKRNLAEVAAFLEVHIEQGPRLEHAGATIGVINAVVGRYSYEVTFRGRSDHAGTTPMNLRADALVAAARFITQANEGVCSTFPNAVLTCGGIETGPNVFNVVPNHARVMIEFRAADEATLAVLDSMVRRAAAESAQLAGVEHTLTPTARFAPCSLDSGIQLAIRIVAEGLGLRHMTFSSGAVHDAHSLAPVVPTGLIFVPSVEGRSHCPQEATSDEDVVAGANTLLRTMLHLADRFAK